MAGKIMAIASLIMLLAPASVVAQPDSYGLSPRDVAAFKKEPPLSQADIDVLLLFWPQIAVNSHPMKVAEIRKKAGLTETRLTYICEKTILGMRAIYNGFSREELSDGNTHPVLIPGEAEMALIEKHMDALKSAFGEVVVDRRIRQAN